MGIRNNAYRENKNLLFAECVNEGGWELCINIFASFSLTIKAKSVIIVGRYWSLCCHLGPYYASSGIQCEMVSFYFFRIRLGSKLKAY